MLIITPVFNYQNFETATPTKGNCRIERHSYYQILAASRIELHNGRERRNRTFDS